MQTVQLDAFTLQAHGTPEQVARFVSALPGWSSQPKDSLRSWSATTAAGSATPLPSGTWTAWTRPGAAPWPASTHLIEDGWDPRFVQEQVGHEHASTTSIYTCVSSDFRTRTLRRHLDATIAAALKTQPGRES
ncbi:tyrosine-type recombinase/integrase [Nonomuraea sp. NPDC003754]